MSREPDPELVRLLSRARCVLLDFDGPVAAMFGGITALVAGLRLREAAKAVGLEGAAADVADDHPLGIFEVAAIEHPDAAQALDHALRPIELEAADTAIPTPGAEEFLRACADTGRPVAIVSNNAREAVQHYLAKHDLQDLVAFVAARSTSDPAEMKPRPDMPLRAMLAVGARPNTCVLVGDSASDMQVARHLAIPAVGYANKPGKARRLMSHGANAVVSDMATLASATVRWNPKDDSPCA